MLAKLREEWQELADLLASQGKSQDRGIEVKKILLRDASDQYRGKIRANPDGCTDLLLRDHARHAWVRLGVILATQAYVLFRPHSPGSAVEALVVRDPNGNIRASLGNTGDKVGLDLWDAQGHRQMRDGAADHAGAAGDQHPGALKCP